MNYAKPAGVRSTLQGVMPGTGGSWELYKRRDGATEFYQELDTLKSTLPPTEHDLLLEELHLLMTEATQGNLTYGDTSEFDVTQTGRHADVLELRVITCRGQIDQKTGVAVKQQVRFYYGEPEQFERELWGAYLIWKYPADANWREQQNDHIDTAHRRLNITEIYRMRS